MLRSVWLNFSHGHRQTISVSSDPTNRRVWMQRFCGAIHHGSFSRIESARPMGTFSSPQRCPSARGSVSFSQSNRANETAGFHRDDERHSGCRENLCTWLRVRSSRDNGRAGSRREIPRDIAARKGENVTSGGRSPRRVAFFEKRRQTVEEPDKCPPAPEAQDSVQNLPRRSRGFPF